MTDARRVIGASTPAGNARRFALLPPALPRVMSGLYAAAAVAVGGRSAAGAAQPVLSASTKFILTTKSDPAAAGELAHAAVCTNHVDLIERFRDSEEELNVIGGLTVFRMFLHHADRLDIAETSAAVPGDLVFDDWVTAGFDVTVVDEWEGGRTLRASRPEGAAARNKRSAMALYDVMFNWNRPRDAARLFLGHEYRQHNPHVADGPGAFVEYFERMAREYPGKRVTFKRAVAEGNLVALHCHQHWPGDHDYAGIDFFRFDDAGRIVEHWDVLQVVPERSANPNGMF